MRSGPVDQSGRRARPDVVSFETDPLDQELLIAGRITATIVGATDGGDADAAVTLVDIDSRGLALNVTDGIRRIRGTRAGHATVFEVDLGDVAHLARRGHRLAIDVAAASFPRFDLVSTGGITTRTVVHGPSGSRVQLPIAV